MLFLLITPEEFSRSALAWINAITPVLAALWPLLIGAIVGLLSVYAAVKSKLQDLEIKSNAQQLQTHTDQIGTLLLNTPPPAAPLPPGTTQTTAAITETTTPAESPATNTIGTIGSTDTGKDTPS